MPLIVLSTHIKAPIQVVFDLSRSIDFHMDSASKTQEKAIAGRISGLIELGETVTWEAVHFGVKQQLTTKITAMEKNRPLSDLKAHFDKAPTSSEPLSELLNCTEGYYFVDEMVKGIFKSIHHEHLFMQEGKTTTMLDLFRFEAPLGLLGRLAEVLVLNKYMTHFLEVRNAAIKKEAERHDQNEN